MEATDSAVRPDRAPDVVTPAGHAIWWEEMVFMGALGGIWKIAIDQENASLYLMIGSKKKVLPQTARDMYDKWWYEVFESKIVDSQNG